jgi:hypothetical protein
VGTLFQIDACTIQCNSSSVFAAKRSIGSTPSQSEPISTSDGHAFWVPKQALASENKFLQRTQCYGNKDWAI